MSELRANVFHVAKYILQKKGTMTTMKLQKLCYYAQAWSLAWDGVPLFEEDFQAWANGPVCPKLFVRHKGKFEISVSDFADITDFDFEKEQLETIVSVVDFYGDKPPY